jgi:xanthosine utilization system XapX-like protein
VKRLVNAILGVAGGVIIGLVAGLVVGGLLYAEITGDTSAPGVIAWVVFGLAAAFVIASLIRERSRDVAWIDRWLADHEDQWTAGERERLHAARKRGGVNEVAREYSALRPDDPHYLRLRPAPRCEPCRGTGLRDRMECGECRGRGVRP